MNRARIPLAALVLALVVALVPALGSAAPLAADSGSAERGEARTAERAKKKKRCKVVRKKANGKRVVKKRVCKKKPGLPTPPPGSPDVPGSTPVLLPTTPPGTPGEPEVPGEPDYPDPPTSSYERVNLIPNGTFEAPEKPTSCFGASANEGSFTASEANPIAGAKSLAVTLSDNGVGACEKLYGWQAGPKVKEVELTAKLRLNAPAGPLEICAVVYFDANVTEAHKCQTILTATSGTVVDVQVKLDTEDKKVQRIFFWLKAGNNPVQATLDDAYLYAEVLKGSEGGGGGGGGGSGCQKAIEEGKEQAPNGPPDPDSPCNHNQDPPSASTYVPTPVTMAPQRPYISLADYLQVSPESKIAKKFKASVDAAVFHGNPSWGYSNADSVLMFARSGNAEYLKHAIAGVDDAIEEVDAQVTAAEKRITEDEVPMIGWDSYLEVGPMIEELAFVYDHGFSLLTPSQKQRWKAYGDQAISNVWSPSTATWGDEPPGTFSWSGWAVNDPGNNYNYSFIQATQLWAIATQNMEWVEFLQEYKFPRIVNYYAELPGGGSREGTGYGTSQRRLWENARMWRASTGETLPVATHARESIDYWVHATVPTRDQYSPIGDLSRESEPNLFDYHENLMREAVMLAPGTAQARQGMWWLTNNSVPDDLTQGFTLRGGMMQPADAPQAPTALTYHATGVGQFFARSSWTTDATWLNFTAGPYDQSHAHEDQGEFKLYRGEWLSVNSNIWTQSGLQGGGGGGGGAPDFRAAVNNVVRFTTSGGQTIRQNHSTSTMTPETLGNGLVKIHADLSDAYSSNDDKVLGWTRDVEFQGNTLKIQDNCQVAAGVSATFQAHVPVQPVNKGGGVVTAGDLELKVPPTMNISFVEMKSLNPVDDKGKEIPEFRNGWRVDVTNPNGCQFTAELKAG